MADYLKVQASEQDVITGYDDLKFGPVFSFLLEWLCPTIYGKEQIATVMRWG